MIHQRPRSWVLLWLAIGAVLTASQVSAHEGPQRILFLHAFDREFSALDAFVAGFRADLTRQIRASGPLAQD